MRVIRNRQVQDDSWAYVGDAEPLPDTPVFVSLARWAENPDERENHPHPVGVKLEPADDVRKLQADLPDIAAFALAFPRFADGRHYSTARILRDQFGYTGDIRATGDILRDQALFLWRCGINVLELRSDRDAQDALAAFGEFTHTYQHDSAIA